MREDEATELIRKIKAECDRADDTCGGCIFYNMSEYGNCPLVGNPHDWEI